MADKGKPSDAKSRPTGSLLGNALTVGSATMASRVTGFLRDIFLAALLGAGPLAEIFVIAFRLPNLFRRLFAEGAFNAAFVPLFTEKLTQDGQSAALAFAARIAAVLAAALAVFTLLAEIFMPYLVLALAQGFAGDAAKFDLAVYYARISFPYLIAMSFMALFAAMLNAVNRFLAAALAPVLLNLVLLAAMAVAVLRLVPAEDVRLLDYIIGAVAVAGIAQLLFVGVAAWRAGLTLSPRVPRMSDDVRQVWTLAVPGILAAGIGQINLLVGTSIATGQQGAAAWLYYADRLYQLPMGVIGVALSVALLPALTRHLAIQDAAKATATQNTALLAAAGLTLPAAAGLFVLAEPIIALLFERGAFTRQDTLATALLVKVFCFGLPAFVFVKALQPSFFARKDTRAPLLDGAIGVAVNIGLSLTFFPLYGAPAIAAATGIAGWVTLGLMVARLATRDQWHLTGALAMRLAAQLAAALAMALTVALLADLLAAVLPHILAGMFSGRFAFLSVLVAACILAGAAIYAVLAVGLGALSRQDMARLRGRNG